MDVGKRSSEQQRKAREKTVDTKRMQDLERQVYLTNKQANSSNLYTLPVFLLQSMSQSFSLFQVKELEHILRCRNPNSLPALIYAAATADSHDSADATKTSPPSRVNALLERRIQRLETELESHDEEAKRSLRAMEQQFHRIKVRVKAMQLTYSYLECS